MGDSKKMLELTSLQSQGAEKLAELTGGMVSSRSHGPALVSRIASYKNLGDGDNQTEEDDDETVIDLKEYTCMEKIWRQWDDHEDSLMSGCRLVETKCELFSLHQPSVFLKVFVFPATCVLFSWSHDVFLSPAHPPFVWFLHACGFQFGL